MKIRPHSRQRGLTLILTLIAVVLLTIAAAATMRAIDSGGLMLANLNTRNVAVQAGDLGIEAARSWLQIQAADMDATPITHLQLFWSQPTADQFVSGAIDGRGYYAIADTFNPLTHNWAVNSVQMANLPAGLNGFTINWVIHRMCEQHKGYGGAGSIGLVETGDSGLPPVAATNCLRASAEGSGDSKNIQDQQRKPSTIDSPYYRITVRVSAPFRSTAFVQAVVY
jgi:type IV pilus assembly protein PilX